MNAILASLFFITFVKEKAPRLFGDRAGLLLIVQTIFQSFKTKHKIMKKIAAIALFCTAFIFGCTDREEFHPNEAPKQEFNSRIEELEANGLKLFKKTITVTDFSGKNSVTLL
ncbi:hypothetical protein GVN20_07280 [Runella sp. CRIBMP]|uniref:hypothetical protein n=1 Tax=Runella sp. CRIBMP TaxID=2683261 RepID=UPI001411DCA1|nr:hypothetical protein [Runella sp. CRIBMP]NBB19152.1 hypothetical protein [Runella sp. CRIBMP]